MIRVKLSFFCLLLLVSANASYAQGDDPKWRFMVFGDSRGTVSNVPVNAVILGELAQATRELRPAFLLFVGDMVTVGSQWAIEQWSAAMAPVYEAGIPVFPVLGNHDNTAEGVLAFIERFGPALPDNGPIGEIDRTYAFTYSNALFVVFDNYVRPHRANIEWLNAVLATNRMPHVFTMGHEPAFKVSHTDMLDDYPVERDAFWNSLSNAGSRVYFCGHDHFFDHTRVDDGDGDPANDIHQYIVGTGGAPFYGDAPYDGTNSIWSPAKVKFEGQFGFVLVEMDGPVATLTWWHRSGTNTYAPGGDLFSYSIAPVLRVVRTDNALRLTWIGPGLLQSASSVLGPWIDLTNAVSGYSITNLSENREFFRVRVP